MFSSEQTRVRVMASAGLVLCLLLSGFSLTSAQISVRVNKVSDESLFQGQEFSRLCYVEGTTESVIFEWLRDEVTVSSGNGLNLLLTISEVDITDMGSYSCRITLPDSSVIGPAEAGELHVLDSGMVVAPPVQYASHGADQFRLNCSYPGAIVQWTKEGSTETVPAVLESLSFNDEGLYKCEILVIDQQRLTQARLTRTIRLHVFVAVDILKKPPPHKRLHGNPPYVMTVAFSGRQAQNMSIIWYRNGLQLPSNQVNNTYSPSQLSGTTEVKFTSVTRDQAGVYRVVIRSELGEGVFDSSDTEAEANFQLDVQVPPATPTDFSTSDVYSTSALFKWTLTNQNADEGADTFILSLTYENGTSFRNETFFGGVSEKQVTELIPGTNYTTSLVAKNVDGNTRVGPIFFTTLPGDPKVNGADIERHNSTHFTVTVSLAYTGGGAISTIILENSNQAPIRIPASPSPDSNLVWTGDFSITDTSLNPADFMVSVLNEHDFNSEARSVVVPPYTTATTVSTAEPEGIDPLLLILICVTVGAVLITTVLMLVVIVTVCICKRNARKSERSYSPQEPANVDLEEKQLQEDNAMVTRGATTDKNLAHATLRLGSVPSIQSSIHSEDRYIDSKKFGHGRTPSNASSKASSSRSHSVSTSTASYSPNTMTMNKMRNEKNAYEETTPSLCESRSQLSQTESEMLKPVYSHSQIRLTNSTSSSPHSSIQNVSMPSFQYRHTSPYELHPPHHRRNYSQTTIEEETLEYTAQQRPHQYQNHSLSISGSEMDARPPSESVCTCSMTTGGEMSPEYVYMQPTVTKQVSVV